MFNLKEGNYFTTVESDSVVNSRARKNVDRFENLLRDRKRKARRIRKMGYTELEPWLMPDQLDRLEGKIKSLRSGHHRVTRNDKAVNNNRRALKPVALQRLSPGVIVDTWIPFAECDDYKRRPAVVVSADKHDVVVMPVTSSLKYRKLKTPIYRLHDWAEAGLSRVSGVQLKTVTVPRSSILGVSGELTGVDRVEFARWIDSSFGSAVCGNLRK